MHQCLKSITTITFAEKTNKNHSKQKAGNKQEKQETLRGIHRHTF